MRTAAWQDNMEQQGVYGLAAADIKASLAPILASLRISIADFCGRFALPRKAPFWMGRVRRV